MKQGFTSHSHAHIHIHVLGASRHICHLRARQTPEYARYICSRICILFKPELFFLAICSCSLWISCHVVHMARVLNFQCRSYVLRLFRFNPPFVCSASTRAPFRDRLRPSGRISGHSLLCSPHAISLPRSWRLVFFQMYYGLLAFWAFTPDLIYTWPAFRSQ